MVSFLLLECSLALGGYREHMVYSSPPSSNIYSSPSPTCISCGYKINLYLEE